MTPVGCEDGGRVGGDSGCWLSGNQREGVLREPMEQLSRRGPTEGSGASAEVTRGALGTGRVSLGIRRPPGKFRGSGVQGGAGIWVTWGLWPMSPSPWATDHQPTLPWHGREGPGPQRQWVAAAQDSSGPAGRFQTLAWPGTPSPGHSWSLLQGSKGEPGDKGSAGLLGTRGLTGPKASAVTSVP